MRTFNRASTLLKSEKIVRDPGLVAAGPPVIALAAQSRVRLSASLRKHPNLPRVVGITPEPLFEPQLLSKGHLL